MSSISFPKLSREMLAKTAVKAKQGEIESPPKNGNGKGYAQPWQSAKGLQQGRFLQPVPGVSIIIPGSFGPHYTPSRTLKNGEVLDLVRKRVRRVQDLGRAWGRDKKQEVLEEVERREADISDYKDEIYWNNFHEAFFEKDDKEALQTQRTRHQGDKKKED